MSEPAVQSKTPALGAGPGLYILIATVFAAALALTIYYCRIMSGGMKMPGGWTMSMIQIPPALHIANRSV